MFPQITKSKKKVKIGTDEMIKQCEFIIRQIQFKAKKAVKNLPNELVSDFHKVCRLKDINSFYCDYFFYFNHKSQKEYLQNVFAEQMQSIMLGKSYYQKISELLKDRSSIIVQVKQQMQTVEGFILMNLGKSVPHMVKGLINNLIKDCSSLDQVKKIQENQVLKLANLIKNLRNNLKQLVQIVISWQFKLKNYNGAAQSTSMKKIKVAYPQNGINCLFIVLYDTQFLKSSFLSHQIKFSNAQFDPFVLNIQKTKRTSKIIQNYFINILEQNKSSFKRAQQYIYGCIPVKQKPQTQKKQTQKHQLQKKQKQKKQLQKRLKRQSQNKKASKSSIKFYNGQRSTSGDKKTSQRRLKQQYLHQKLLSQIGDQPRRLQKIQNLKKQINIDYIASIYKKNNKRKSKDSIYKKQSSLQNKLSRSKSKDSVNKSMERAKSVVFLQERDVTVTQSQKRNSQKSKSISSGFYKNQYNHRNSKNQIQNISKLLNKKSANLSYIKKQSNTSRKDVQYGDVQTILNQKKQLIKQLQKQKKEQEILKNMFQKIQKRTSSENRLYQQKMEGYKKQINKLKQRIQQRQKKNIQKMPSPQKINSNNNLINKIYKKNRLQSNLSPQIQGQSPQKNLMNSRLMDQRNTNKLLQNKINQLTKQKLKLEKLIDKQGSKANKQREVYERKIQKYQQMIANVRNQANQSKKSAKIMQKNYSSLKGRKEQKIQQIKKDNILNLYARKSMNSPQKPVKNKKQLIQIKVQQQKKLTELNDDNPANLQSDLKITNDKNTIQIVYTRNKKKKSIAKQLKNQLALNNPNDLNSSLLKQKQRQYELEKSRLQKERQALQRKLDIRMNSKSGTQIQLMKKLQQSQQRIQKYKQLVQKEKYNNIKYEGKMKQLRKTINVQFESKLQRQRSQFQKQKQHLFYKIKQQKQAKMQKDKYLSKQMIFLKQMQMRQNQLIAMLQKQRKQRQQKQKQLQQQIMKKQQILQQYQLQQIKRVIQKQVRQEMNMLNQEEQEEQQKNKPQNFEIRKQQIQKEIQEMIQMNNMQLEQIDEENQKLKQLIEKIKQEEQQVINNLRHDIQIESSENLDDNQSYLINSQLLSNSKIRKIGSAQQLPNNDKQKSEQDKQKNQIDNAFQRNDSLIAELKFKSDLQLSREKLNHSRYQAIQQSPNYKQRQKIENIIEHYLKNPHQYPNNKSIVMKKQQKEILVDDLVAKSKKAKQFQQQLMQLRNVQSFVPAQRDDPITNHMLNLREAYQNQQAQSLRRILFPAINENERFGQNQQLSFQSEDPPPPVTFGERLNAHQQNYIQKKKENNKKSTKNFMTINKMKLLQIQQEKKQKLRSLIEQEGKKKAKKIFSKSKKQQKKDQQQFLQIKKQLQEKQKKREKQLQKAKIGVQKLNQDDEKKLKKVNKVEKQENIALNQSKKEKKVNQQDKISKNIENKDKVIKQSNKNQNKPIKKEQQASNIQQLMVKTKQQIPSQKKQTQLSDKNIKLKDQRQNIVIKKQNQKEQTKQEQCIQIKKQNFDFDLLQQQGDQEKNQFLTQQHFVNHKAQRLDKSDDDLNQSNQKINLQRQAQKSVQSEKPNEKSVIQQKSIKQNKSAKQQKLLKQTKSVKQKKKSQEQNNQFKNNNQYKNQQQANEDKQQYQEQFQPEIQKQDQQLNQFLVDMTEINSQKPIKQNQDMKKLIQQLNKNKQLKQQKQQQKQQKQNQSQQDENQQVEEHQKQSKKSVKSIKNHNQAHQFQQPPGKDYTMPSQNIALMLLQKQKQQLKSDILSYQQQIRSYISSYSQFSVYQHFIVQKQLQQYINQILQLSSAQIKNLNNNKTLWKDINQAQNLVILIAKDKQSNLQLGIGLFHKQYQEGQYICDYLLAHNMKNFLNLTFNFSRFIYQSDQYCHSTQYIFTLNALQDQLSKLHFNQFQNKCKRLGEVYVKGKQSNTRKYVLKRILFQNMQNDLQNLKQQKGIKFTNKIQIHQNLMKQRNSGYFNKFNENYTSPTVLLSLFLKYNSQVLEAFKKRTENELKYRQALLTAMVFQKKQFSLKAVQSRTFDTEEKLWLYKNIFNDKFNVQDVQQKVQELEFDLSQLPPKKFKRCILQMNEISEPYCFVQFNEPLNQAQASNSAQIGTFLALVPKFKVLIIPGGQFLQAAEHNPDMNVFFYTKHFIKNITDVKKQNYSRVYLPEINIENWTFYKSLSEKLNMTIFGKQEIQIGFQTKLNNSIVYTPHHKDLVFQKPFIISVLSANVERAIEGSPIFCKLIV